MKFAKDDNFCQIGPEKFDKKCNLTRHIRTVHENKKPFQCSIRQKAFATKHNLKNHIITVHEKDKPFHCEL